MKIKITHIKTRYEATVDNSSGNLVIEGNEALVKGLNTYFDSFRKSILLPGQKEQAFNQYDEDLIIQDGSVYSINTKSDKFLLFHFVKDMQNMGYTTEIYT